MGGDATGTVDGTVDRTVDRVAGGTGARVASLHRYPVKSLLGEPLDRLEVDRRGCVGDRGWAVRTADGALGSGKAGRRFVALPGLQLVRALLVDDEVVLRLPDGTEVAATDPAASARLSDHVGRPVRLARETDESHFDDGPVSLLGTASVAAVAGDLGAGVPVDRFRANVVVRTSAPWAEDAWAGRRLRVGGALLHVVATVPRCVMVDAETADHPAQRGVLKAVGRLHEGELGVVAEVVVPGLLQVGDAVELVGDGRPAVGR